MASQAQPDAELAAALSTTKAYYSAKVGRFGANHLGVDWPSLPSQLLRFVQLLKLCAVPMNASWNDVGCGYGALLGFLAERWPGTNLDYAGVDLSPAMIAQARALWRQHPASSFVVGHHSPRQADYSVASGVFNVQLDIPNATWDRFIRRTLGDMRRQSSKGMAVNFKTVPPNGKETRCGLYYTHPEPWRRFCEHDLGWPVELVAGYGVGEFTLLLRSPAAGSHQGTALSPTAHASGLV